MSLDSQVFELADRQTPEDILLTSFSILFARYKGNLAQTVRGALALETELYLLPELMCYVNWIWHPPGYDTEGDVCREPDGTFGRMCGGFLPNWFEAVEVSLYDEAKEEDVTVRYDRYRLVKLAEERNGFRSYGREECCYNEID